MTTETGPLAAALAKAQAAFPAISRDREVTVSLKTGGSYKFKYAPLDTILAAVRQPLSDQGLAISQLLDGNDLVTLLLHESGAMLEGRMPLPYGGADTIQQHGSAITYMRRYALQAILGIAAEEDDDGNAAAGQRASATERPRQRPTRTDVDRTTGEILPSPRQVAAAGPVEAQGPSDADIAALRERFSKSEVFVDAPTIMATGQMVETFDLSALDGLSSADLFSRAEEAGIPSAKLTLTAKTMFGANRWKITDLTDQERLAIWDEVQ